MTDLTFKRCKNCNREIVLVKGKVWNHKTFIQPNECRNPEPQIPHKHKWENGQSIHAYRYCKDCQLEECQGEI